MGQVGAHHDERALIQHGANDRRNLLRRGVAHEQRYKGEMSEHRLQERQLDLERMLRRMGPIVDGDEPRFDERGNGVSIDLDLTKGCGAKAFAATGPEYV